MEQKTHSHQTVTPFALRDSKPDIFTCRSHHTYDLVKYLTRHLKTRHAPRQAALNKFWSFTCLYYCSAPVYNTTSDNVILQAYLDLFDDVFFFGSLKKRCAVKLQRENKESFTSPLTVRACSLMSGDIMSEIMIYALKIGDREQRILAYLGILLHEMIHVFLITYGCAVKAISEDRVKPKSSYRLVDEIEVKAELQAKTRNTCWENLYGGGGLGYGRVWQEIAYSFELVARDLFCLKLNLLRKWSMVADLCLSKSYPNLKSEWGLDEDQIRRLVGENDMIVLHICRKWKGIVEWLVQQEYGAGMK